MAIGRPLGSKNNMRTPEEKEKIVLEARSLGTTKTANKYFISDRLLRRWLTKYDKDGIEGLKSHMKNNNPNFGKHNRHLSEVDKLKRELAKKDIEIERLKKGYTVKGVGAKKEYVTTFDKNTK